MNQPATIKTLQKASPVERGGRVGLIDKLNDAPIPQDEMWQNLPLFVNRQCLTQMLFMDELYQRILNLPGAICEFGVRFGRNLVMYQNLAGIYEPFNHTRRVIGFDTFTGFPSVDAKDGKEAVIGIGSFGVPAGYEDYLNGLMKYHASENPISHIARFELVKGDAIKTVPKWLAHNPATQIALAYFDFDLYAPTEACLRAIMSRLMPGSVIVFDEFSCEHFPGETLAAKELLDGLRFIKSRFAAYQTVAIWE